MFWAMTRRGRRSNEVAPAGWRTRRKPRSGWRIPALALPLFLFVYLRRLVEGRAR
jgi:hypothetical protein